MVKVVAQNGTDSWLIEAFWISPKAVEDTEIYEMIGLARLNVSDTAIVKLGEYLYHSQAMWVFADLDYCSNDLMYYRTQAKTFWMPEAILDERECVKAYGGLW